MDNNIPKQFTGKTVDYYNSLDFTSEAEAVGFFERAKNKLINVNNWNQIADGPSAEFVLTDTAGQPLQRTIEKDDHIRINIPGPGLPSSHGYDWVLVEEITEESTPDARVIAVTLRPSPDPTETGNDTAHFFSHLASSTIVIEQKMTNVFVRYAGRNEVVNTENESTMDNIRNFLIGLGAKLGASKPQWKALIDGLSKKE